MRISRIRIVNFANFERLDVVTGDSIVVVGENKVGKSNFIRALQLVLDPGLSERDRHLGLDDFWDGLGEDKLGATVEVFVELTDFTDDPRLMAHLCDCVAEPGPPMVARLTYRFQPKAGLEGDPEGLADYECVIFGGSDPDMAVGGGVRRMLPLDIQGALRDAEKDLASWRRSPLRPLIEELMASVDDDAREVIQTAVNDAQAEVEGLDEVGEVAGRIGERLIELAGPQHAVPISLGVAPTQIDALLRGLRILIDGGARGIGEASLGTANLIFLALKCLELDRLVEEGQRDHTFFAVEEPEAHLHPHVQRLVYRYFLETGTAANDADAGANLTTILTTHSPHVASVSPIRSIVLLRHDSDVGASTGISAAQAPLEARDIADLQRYIDVNRGELFFARGVILVEGEAERFLVPAFAEAGDGPLDILGITVCSVGGTNFEPYVKLLGPDGLDIPHVVLTDLDPNGDRPVRARRRIIRLLRLVEDDGELDELDDEALFAWASRHGYFVNGSTLEFELFDAGMGEAMMAVIEGEMRVSRDRRRAFEGWIEDPDTLDEDRLMRWVERIGKGRFAQSLSGHVSTEVCPGYIRSALEHIRDAVS
jgi:putative ATP-dependent endonuclease of OLD family